MSGPCAVSICLLLALVGDRVAEPPAVEAPSARLASLEVAAGRQPRVAAGADGSVAVVYARGDTILCRLAKDHLATFGPEVRVADVAGLMVGRRSGPHVALTSTGLVVTAIGRAGDLLAWTSGDRGRSWSGPIAVTDAPGAAREGLQGLSAGAGDTVHAVWLDLRNGPTQIYATRSTDGGRTWRANARVYRSPDGHTCECCSPSVAADGRGTVAVLWRNWVGGARDMYLTVSHDGGGAFAPAQKLGEGTWPLEGCPMDGGGVAIGASGIRTVWRRADTVYAAAPGAAEETRALGAQPVVTSGPGGFFEAWQTEKDLVARGPSGVLAAGRTGRFPSIAAAPGGRGPVVLVWEDPSGAVRAARLDNATAAAVPFPSSTGRAAARP